MSTVLSFDGKICALNVMRLYLGLYSLPNGNMCIHSVIFSYGKCMRQLNMTRPSLATTVCPTSLHQPRT